MTNKESIKRAINCTWPEHGLKNTATNKNSGSVQRKSAGGGRQKGQSYQSLSSPDASASFDLGGGFLAALAAGLPSLALGFLDFGSLPRLGFSGASLHNLAIWRERETDRRVGDAHIPRSWPP